MQQDVTIPAARYLKTLADVASDDWAPAEPLEEAEAAVLDARPQSVADVAVQLMLVRDQVDHVARATDANEADEADAAAERARATLARAVAFLADAAGLDLARFGGEFYGVSAAAESEAAA